MQRYNVGGCPGARTPGFYQMDKSSGLVTALAPRAGHSTSQSLNFPSVKSGSRTPAL